HPGGYGDHPSSRGLLRNRLTRPDARVATPARPMIMPPQRIADSDHADEDGTDSRKAARSPGYAPHVMWCRWTC
ncbi:MAG TPA: hypothetical protein VK584_08160, partial [Streptosporangiaceae bacterium]|nr:hypothetical protein [Streptosporangiaceae bacterium]